MENGKRSSLKGRVILTVLWGVLFLVPLIFRKALLPFAIAAIVAYLLEPAVTRLAGLRLGSKKIPRWTAVISIYLVFFLLLYIFGRVAVNQLYGELVELTRQGSQFLNSLTPKRINELTDKLEIWFFSRGIPLELSPDGANNGTHYGLSLDIERSIREGLAKLSLALKTHFLDAVGFLQKLLGGVLGFVFSFFFILMVAGFMLVDWHKFGQFGRSLIPQDRQADFDEILHAVDKKLAGVVRGQAIICLVNGSLTAIGLLVLRIPFIFVLTTVATVLSAIPIFGTIISSVPIVLIALTHGLQKGVAMLAWILGIHALEAYFLNPKIMGLHAQMHPVLVAFALLAGEATFGFSGALFAVPVAGVFAAIFTCAHERALRR